MRSQHIPGDGVEHEQNYIEERMINAGKTNELAAQSEQLEDEVRDLQNLSTNRSSGSSQEASSDALRATANMPTGSGDVIGESRAAAPGAPVDGEQLLPTSEARSRVVSGSGGGEVGS
jgi:hypothetical protein